VEPVIIGENHWTPPCVWRSRPYYLCA